MFSRILDWLLDCTVSVKSACIIKYGIPTINGHIYDKNSIDIEDFKSTVKLGRMLGQLTSGFDNFPDPTFHIDNASFIVTNVEKNDVGIKIDVRTLKNDNGNALMLLIKNNLVVFKPVCIGRNNQDGIVDSAKIVSIDAIWISNK